VPRGRCLLRTTGARERYCLYKEKSSCGFGFAGLPVDGAISTEKVDLVVVLEPSRKMEARLEVVVLDLPE
jgi:hypothetical protein